MATISFGGLGNGLDFGQVVDQLVKASRFPVDRLNAKKADLNAKSTDYATLSTKLIALQSAADKMRLPSNFDRSSVSVSDTTVLTGFTQDTLREHWRACFEPAPNAKVQFVEDSRRLIMLDRPQEFDRAVIEFVGGVAGGAGAREGQAGRTPR